MRTTSSNWGDTNYYATSIQNVEIFFLKLKGHSHGKVFITFLSSFHRRKRNNVTFLANWKSVKTLNSTSEIRIFVRRHRYEKS